MSETATKTTTEHTKAEGQSCSTDKAQKAGKGTCSSTEGKQGSCSSKS